METAAATSAAKAKALDPKITDDDAVVGVETGLVTPGREPLVLSNRGPTWCHRVVRCPFNASLDYDR